MARLKNKSTKTGEPWVIALSSFISIICIKVLSDRFNFSLANFTDRTIGIGSLEGYNLSLRTSLYLLSAPAFISIYLTSNYLLTRLSLTINLNFKSGLKRDKFIIYSVSVALILILALLYLTGIDIYNSIFNRLLLVYILYLLIVGGKIHAKINNRKYLTILKNYHFVTLSFFLPLVCIFIFRVLNGDFFILNFRFIYPTLFSLYWFLLFLCFRFTSLLNNSSKRNALLISAVPVLLIPFFVGFSSEIQFIISDKSDISTNKLAVILITLLLISALTMFGLTKNRIVSKTKNYTGKYYLPIFIASLVFFKTHTNYISVPGDFDLFHHGENLLSAQQLFNFGLLPFIDIYPTHGASYLISQVLYSIVNGYKPFEPWLWEWIPKVFEITLLYFFLKKIFNSFVSTLVIACLPILGLLGGKAFVYGYNTTLVNTYYLSPLLCALSIEWMLKNPTIKRLYVHWFACFFLLFWRLDFGLACFGASLIILCCYLLSMGKRKKERTLLVRNIVISITKVFLGTLVTLLTIHIVRDTSIIENAAILFQFVKFQAEAQGLLNVALPSSKEFVFQYLLLPVVIISYFLIFASKSIQQTKNSFDKSRSMLLFLAAFTFIISIRSVQRQTLASIGYNPYLLVVLVGLLPFYIFPKKKEFALAYFLATIFVYQMIFPNHLLLAETGQKIDLHTWSDKEPRTRVNTSQFKNVVGFLDNNLEKNQTFLDLTSSPLLYIATNRKFPNYFIPTAYNTSEIIQKSNLKRLIKLYEANELPLVFFRRQDNFANNIDNVPNEIRSYRVYEFIYQHYYPIINVDGFDIWGSDKFGESGKYQRLESPVQQFETKKLPYLWGKYDTQNPKLNSEIVFELVKDSVELVPNNFLKLDIPNNATHKTSYFHFKVSSNTNGALTLSFNPDQSQTITFEIAKSEIPQDYLVRVSTLYTWWTSNNLIVNISSTTPIEIYAINIIKGD